MNAKVSVSAKNVPPSKAPLSAAIVSDGFLFISGQTPRNPVTEKTPEDVMEQTKQVFANIEAILVEQGCTLDDIVRTTVYLSDMEHFSAMNAVYESCFTQPYPARTTVGVQLRGIDVEIDAIVKMPQAKA